MPPCRVIALSGMSDRFKMEWVIGLSGIRSMSKKTSSITGKQDLIPI